MVVRQRGKFVFDGVGLRDNKELDFASGATMRYGSGYMQGPNPQGGMWANCPSDSPSNHGEYFFYKEDFLVGSGGGWVITNTSGYARLVNQATSGVPAGGVLLLGLGAQSGNLVTWKANEETNGGFLQIKSGYPVWYEARWNPVLNTAESWFVGLIEPAQTAAIGAHGDLANTSAAIGFHCGQSNGTVVNFVVAASGTATVIGSSIATETSAEWHTFGFHYDGDDTITPYADGVAGDTYSRLSGKLTENMTLVPATSLANFGDAAKTGWLDWVRVVGKRG